LLEWTKSWKNSSFIMALQVSLHIGRDGELLGAARKYACNGLCLPDLPRKYCSSGDHPALKMSAIMSPHITSSTRAEGAARVWAFVFCMNGLLD
jgi:hypothetical protein